MEREACRKAALQPCCSDSSRWRAGPCLAAQSFDCLAAPLLCLSASLFLWPSLWMESLVRVILGKVACLSLLS